MERNNGQSGVSPAQAVLLGALAPGVNGPTWITLKSAFFMLGVCLSIMLGLAFSSSDSYLILHVVFLVLITATLFSLLSWRPLYEAEPNPLMGPCQVLGFLKCSNFFCRFLTQTGLVSVEHQMQELDLVPSDRRR